MKRLKRKPKMTILSVILILSIIAGSMPLSGYAAPIYASAVIVRLEPAEAAADVGQQASFNLIVEGLGTDPDNNQISAISFSSSDTSVADHISHTGPSVYTPTGGEEPTGLVYSVNATAANSYQIAKRRKVGHKMPGFARKATIYYGFTTFDKGKNRLNL